MKRPDALTEEVAKEKFKLWAGFYCSIDVGDADKYGRAKFLDQRIEGMWQAYLAGWKASSEIVGEAVLPDPKPSLQDAYIKWTQSGAQISIQDAWHAGANYQYGLEFNRRYGPTIVIEIERETDSRWIADIPALPGVMAYGESRLEAVAKALTLRDKVVLENLTQTVRK